MNGRTTLLASSFLLGMAALAPLPTAAAPLSGGAALSSSAAMQQEPLLTRVQARRHNGGRRGGGGHGGGGGGIDAGGAAALGIIGAIGTLMVIDAARQQQDQSDAVAYCMQRFRSYNPRTGFYVGFDGRPRRCP